MAKQTPNFGLTLFPQSDTTTSVREFRTTLAGDSASSNMMLIDQALKDIQDGQVALPSNLVIWDDGQLTDTLPIPTLSPEIPIVADIAARDALDATTGMLVYVENASADPAIESGGACYIYNAPSWLMIAAGSVSSGSSGGGSIVSQPDEPDDPNAMIWIDTDDQQAGVDLSTKADLVNGKVSAGQLPTFRAGDWMPTAAEVGAAAKVHTHTKADITDFPTTPADIGAAATNHTHTAANITGLSGTDYGTNRVRGISAGTTDLTAGTSTLESGTIYLVYE